MKIFTTGRYGRVPGPLAAALGISAASNHCQARVLVAAANKHEAHLLLAGVGLSVNFSNPDFRQAMGNDVDCLAAAGQLAAPIVLARSHANGPVAKIEADGYTIIGTYRSGAQGDAGSFEPRSTL